MNHKSIYLPVVKHDNGKSLNQIQVVLGKSSNQMVDSPLPCLIKILPPKCCRAARALRCMASNKEAWISSWKLGWFKLKTYRTPMMSPHPGILFVPSMIEEHTKILDVSPSKMFPKTKRNEISKGQEFPWHVPTHLTMTFGNSDHPLKWDAPF